MTEPEITTLLDEIAELKKWVAGLLRQLDAEREANETLKLRLIAG